MAVTKVDNCNCVLLVGGIARDRDDILLVLWFVLWMDDRLVRHEDDDTENGWIDPPPIRLWVVVTNGEG